MAKTKPSLKAYHINYEGAEWQDDVSVYIGTRSVIVWAISQKKAAALFQVEIDDARVLLEADTSFEIDLVPRRPGIYYL